MPKTIIEICRWSEANWKLTNILKSKADVKWYSEEEYNKLRQDIKTKDMLIEWKDARIKALGEKRQ